MITVGVSEYNEKEVLGRGAYGTVYRGQSMKSKDKKVLAAIKLVILKPNLSSEWIEREMKILKALSNPPSRNIVTLLHLERKDTDIYFIMELCNGGNLLEYLQCKKKLDENTIKIFLKQIANGLKVAHGQNIIHRDLKPENLLLCFSGEKYPAAEDITLKIADFGIGRYLSAGALADTWCGTQGYMAPEILLNRRPGYDYKVDLWSVGVIAYQCLVGSLPQTPIEIPRANNPALTAMLTGLLQDDQGKRLNSKQFLNHEFLSTIVSVFVAGPMQQHRTIQIKDNSSVDELIDKIRSIFALGTDSENVYLVHDGRTLKRKSGNSLLDSDIVHNSIITFVMSVSGGCNSDLDCVHL